MNASTTASHSTARRTDRKRDILREFFAAALVLAAIKSADANPVPAGTRRR